MKTEVLDYKFPPDLVATEARPRGESRIFSISKSSKEWGEISWNEFFNLFSPGDLLVLNNTKVLKARLMIDSKKEIFFLKTLVDPSRWQVLSKGMKARVGKEFELPGGVRAVFEKTGLMAEIRLLDSIDFDSYFEKHGHVPLPPYILALRKNHSDLPSDLERYQTIWAEGEAGSVAAPTASLHFNDESLKKFASRGVDLAYITLHVGAGTFLPIDVDDTELFKIHSESVFVSHDVATKIKSAKATGKKVWACGTTVVRSLESAGLSAFNGETDLFIKPGFKFKVVDGLLTNFHQPQSSLLLLAATFAGQGLSEKEAVGKILKAYDDAIEKKFRLFSYGDLTVIS